MARPKINIDWEKVDKYLIAGATGTEVAAVLGVHADTLYRKCQEDHKIGFTDYLLQKRESGNSMLRLKQFEEAMEGDRGMLIWLGKNRLDQSDKKEVKHDAVVTEKKQDLSKLNLDELRRLRELSAKLRGD